MNITVCQLLQNGYSQVAGFITYSSPKRPCATNRPQFDVRIQMSDDGEIKDEAYKKLQDFDRSKKPCRVKLFTSPKPLLECGEGYKNGSLVPT